MSVLAITGGFVLLVALAVVFKAKRLGEHGVGGWSEAASRVHLAVSNDDRLAQLVQRHRVLVDVRRREQGGRHLYDTVLRMNVPHVAASLTLRSETRWSRMQKLVRGEDVLLHDDDFDRRVHVQGEEAIAVGLLNDRLRAALLDFVERQGGQMDGGVLSIEMPGVVTDARRLLAVVESLIELSEAMDVDRQEIDGRLAHNAAHERQTPVRLRNLNLLVARDPNGSLARQTASRLLSDEEARVRLAAARVLLDEPSFQVLGALVSSRRDDALGQQALSLLLEHWSYEQCLPWVDVALGSDSARVGVIAVDAVVKAGDRARLPLLVRCAGSHDSSLAAAAARAFGELGDGSDERVLLPLLTRDDDHVQLAAVGALGRIGTVACVGPLLSLTSGLRLPGAVKEAAREAIRRIQARVGPVDGGRLSLVDEHAASGGLSLSVEGGELSLEQETQPANRARQRE